MVENSRKEVYCIEWSKTKQTKDEILFSLMNYYDISKQFMEKEKTDNN